MKIIFACLALLICTPLLIFAQNETRPNIILINLDDADLDMFRPDVLAARYPNLSRLANEGLRFTNFHVTTPLCGPSRACLLRGQYAHATGIKVNQTGSLRANGYRGGTAEYFARGHHLNDLSVWMKNAGYHTALIGKYLNNGNANFVPPGWDEFYFSLGGNYYNSPQFTTRTNPQGSLSYLTGNQYRTNIETADCLNLLSKHYLSGSSKPFFFYLAPYAPHLQFSNEHEMYDLTYASWWPNLRVPLDPDFDEVDFTDKPQHLQVLSRLKPSALQRMNVEYRNRALSMISVDRMIALIRHRLAALNMLTNTYIIVTSDNGYQLGHHRETGKISPYNRNTNVPLIVWGPNVQPGVADHLLANIDLAPTILDLANRTSPGFVQGKSFEQLIHDPTSIPAEDWRFGILIENWEDMISFGTVVERSYVSLRMHDKIFTRYSNGAEEFYQQSLDPFELGNAIAQVPSQEANFYQLVMQQMRANPVTAIVNMQVNDAASSAYTNHQIDLTGIAEHRFGIHAVRVSVRHAASGLYLNGTEWQTEFAAASAILNNFRGQLSTWQHTIPVHTIPGDYGNLVITARPIDIEGVAGHPLVHRLVVDRIDPDTILDTPANQSVLNSPVSISGRATDQSPIRELRLVMQNLDTGLYFDGVSWQQSLKPIILPVNADGRWSYQFASSSGRYRVSARAFDAAGNYDRTPALRTFRIN
ncbi:MAG TPA: sulfatase-like hydrolase/transferase [Pirellulaceae bacterium]|nr:sulfatase-like hydrolase/transferase [Pirellulaceae bacterium]HMP69568.1 sulfatase-like hydrolase/transferase [Pirellulaceae bacterium]